jgi:hypothetical protein
VDPSISNSSNSLSEDVNEDNPENHDSNIPDSVDAAFTPDAPSARGRTGEIRVGIMEILLARAGAIRVIMGEALGIRNEIYDRYVQAVNGFLMLKSK